MFPEVKSRAGQAAGYIEQISNGFPGRQKIQKSDFGTEFLFLFLYFLRSTVQGKDAAKAARGG